jgi:hypothetical protein
MNEEERLRSIRFPQWLWDRIDEDAKRSKRSSVKQMETVLSLYYGAEEAMIDRERLVSLKAGGNDNQVPVENGQRLAAKSASKIPIRSSEKQPRKRKTGS